ncbi:MAG: phosphotransferase family protein [Acidimicrobiales bacterium]
MTGEAPATAEGAGRDVPDGIDGPRVTEWLVREVDEVVAPVRFELIAGGHSNLTFLVTDAAGRRMVLRRPPISHVLSTAHDMGREYRIISALASTPVPVAGALGFCDDETVNGPPFYVMDFVEGHILRDSRTTREILSEEQRRTTGNDLVEVLVAIHQVDVDAVGLGDLGRREAYVARQLKRWNGQFLQSQAQEQEGGFGRPAPMVSEVHETLVERMPPQHASSIVHGDYRLDNTMIGDGGRVKAVLDWELCTLGEPLADLGTLYMYWSDRNEAGALPVAPTTALPGFPTRKELAERYSAVSGRDVSDLPYYVAFAHWRLACIIEGVYVRYAAGAMGGDTSASAGFADMVIHQAEQARQALTQL